MRNLFFAVALITASATYAEDAHPGPSPIGQTVYVGLAGLYSNANASDQSGLASAGIGLSANFGWRILPYLGLEAAYEQWGSAHDVAAGSRNASTIRTLAGDLYGYWPGGRHGWFQPFVTIGLGATGLKARNILTYETAAKVSNGVVVINTDGTPKRDGHRDVTPLTSPSSTHLRIGGGVEWTMGDHVARRVTGRYQPYRLGDVINHGTSVSLALLVRI